MAYTQKEIAGIVDTLRKYSSNEKATRQFIHSMSLKAASTLAKYLKCDCDETAIYNALLTK